MSLTADVQAALSLLERLQGSLRGCDDPRMGGVQCTNDLNTLISVLHNPVLNKIVTIQDSLKELKGRLIEHPSLLPDDFSICRQGKLVVSTADENEGTEKTPFAPRPPPAPVTATDATPEIASRTERPPQLESQTRTTSLTNSEPQHLSNFVDQGGPEGADPHLKGTSWGDRDPHLHLHDEERRKVDYFEEDENENIPLSIMSAPGGGSGGTTTSTTTSFDGNELRKVLALGVQGREIHHIKLYKPEGASLGFSVVGLKSEQRGDLGIYVQDIQATGIAAQDGRLQDGDQILAIDGQVLESYISHDEAISILQKAYKIVDLIVARAPSSDRNKGQILHQDSIQKQQKQQSFEETRGKESPTPPPQSNTPHIVPAAHDSQLPQSYNMLNTDWAQVEVIHLVNDGSGLGFGIIGGRSTGVVVKTILPSGVADRDGRLQSGDHILQIGEVNLRGMGSDQVASVLRQAGSHVRLVVARPVESASPDYQVGRTAPIVETRLLNDAEELERHLGLVTNGFPSSSLTSNVEGGCGPASSTSSGSTVPAGGVTTNGHHLDLGYINGDSEILTVTNQLASTSATAAVLTSDDVLPTSSSSESVLLLQHHAAPQGGGGGGSGGGGGGGGSGRVGTPSPSDCILRKDGSLDVPVAEGGEGLSIADLPEMETIYLTLVKDLQGLGITIAGYVCEREELSGIFVKSINAGSAADRSGQIQVNDQIVEVDGRSLSGLSNHAAVEVLRATGQEVRLKLARYLRGPKFEQLQQAIANSELKTTPTTPNPPRAPLGELPSSEALRNALDNLESANERLQGDLAEAYNTSLQQISTSAIPTSELPHHYSSAIAAQDSCRIGHTPYDAPFDNQMKSGSSADVRLQDIQIMIDNDFSGDVSPSVELAIQRKWSRIVGHELEIVVAQLCKFERGGGLGISLEGTVDVEDGKEVRPHHYIRSILPDGPVGRDARLRSGDELLEVNNQKLLGLNHVEVVTILKELPQAVRLVCGRKRMLGTATPLHPIDAPTSDRDTFAARNILGGSLQNLLPSSERLVKAKSDGSLASSTAAASSDNNSFTKMKSRSLEPLTGLAMWSSEPQEIELVKGDRGLGFSILDYQDPLNPLETVIVIRSLVPGGVAEKDGRLIPGDRLVAVNGTSLENASLDQAVAVLKGAPKGPVRIAVAKPVSVLESPGQLDLILGEVGSSEGESDLTENVVTARSDEDEVERDERPSSKSLPEEEEEKPRREERNDSALSFSSQDAQDLCSSEPTSLEQDTAASVLMVPVATERLIGGSSSASSASASSSGGADGAKTADGRRPLLAYSASAQGEGGIGLASSFTGPSSGEDEVSPQGSPFLTKWSATGGPVPLLPKELQKNIRVRKGADQLGVNIEVVDHGQNGVVVSSLVRGGAVHKDGRLHAGDFIVSVNNESMRNITNSQARAILRRTQLVSTDIYIVYVPGEEAAKYRESLLNTYRPAAEQSQDQISPRSPYVRGDSSEEELLQGASRGDLPRSVTAPSFVTRQIKSRDGSQDDLLNFEGLQEESLPPRDAGSPAVTVVNLKNAISEVLGTEDLPPSQRGPPSHREGSEDGPFTITFRNVTEAGVVGSQETADSVEGALTSSITVTTTSDTRTTNGVAPMIDGKHWGPERTVEVRRDENKSLGISIVGGKVNLSWTGSSVSGIFVKNVLPNSPAGKSGLLKTGDRILEVEGVDLRSASHEKAVEVIKKTGNPVTFVVQSLVQWTPPNSAPVSRDASRLGTHAPESVPPARTPTPELIQAGLPDHKKQELQEKMRDLTSQQQHQQAIAAQQAAAAQLDESEEEDDEEDDFEDTRELQGMTTTAKGKQIERASAGALKLPKADQDEEEDEYGYTAKKILKKYGPLGGEVQLVDLQKGSSGLGISLAGHKDRTQMSVFVCGMNPSGNAFKDGRIRIGDEVLEVNGNVLQGRSHLNASSIFKGIPGPGVKIVVRRKPSGLKDMAVRPITHFPVTLDDESPEERYSRFKGLTKFVMKKGQSGLGIMIIEGKHSDYGQGIFISDLQEGSIAAEAGLMVGDMILGVNKEDMIGVDYEQAANILKKTEGVINMWVANAARIPGGPATTTPDKSRPGEQKKPEIPPKPTIPPKPSIKPPPMNSPPSQTTNHATTMMPSFASTTTVTLSSSHLNYPPSHPPPKSAPPANSPPPSNVGLNSATSEISALHSVHATTTFASPSTDEQTADPHSAEIKPGKETTIEIIKEKMGLGLSIVGGSDTLLGAIIIHEVYPDGAAAKDGRLKPGDQILEVNNENFRVITHQKALNVLRQTPSKVKMVVYREEASQKEEDMYDITNVQLTKKSGKGLGLSIVGRKNGPGVFISDLVPSGVAESDGRLMQGDQILEVNSKDLRNATQEQAAAILKCAPANVSMKIGRLKPGKKVSQTGNMTWPVTISDGTPRGSAVSPEGPFPQPPLLLSSHIVQQAQSLSPPLHAVQPPPQQQPPAPGAVPVAGQHSPTLGHQHMDKLPVTVTSSPPSVQTVLLDRGDDGLGFSIVGGFGSNLGDLPIYVKSVFNRGAAAREGSLRRGDQILKVNGQSLAGLSHAQAVAILKEARGTVTLSILPSK